MLIPAGFVCLIAVAGAVSDNDEPDGPPNELAAVATTAATVASPYFQPVIEGQDDDGPFWTTTFAVIVPADHWEGVESPVADDNLCKPVGEESYRLTNDRGVLVAAFDQAQTLVFTRSTSEVLNGECHVEVATMGDYQDDLGNSYLLTNGTLQATFSPEQLFSGQDAGTNSIAPLVPVAGIQALVAESSTTMPPPTTTTAPPTTAAPTTAAPTTRPPTTAAPTTTRPPTTQTAYYANCDAARSAGVAPLHRGDPGYRSALDRDDDGIACE